jgi:hypothetical protein
LGTHLLYAFLRLLLIPLGLALMIALYLLLVYLTDSL